MDDLKQQALDLQAEIEAAAEHIDVDSKILRRLELEKHQHARGSKPAREHARLVAVTQPWLDLQTDIDNLVQDLETTDNETRRADFSSRLNELVLRLRNQQS